MTPPASAKTEASHPLTSPGTLVRARNREWVVLPDSTDELLKLRPLGGLDEEITGVLTAIEQIEPATFKPPTINDLGDFASGRLLRDAARLSTRAAAGPFRSFARIAVEPRPYQLVPLMMALRLDPVRLLIADDVGIGKTIEACLIARELLDRGEITSMAVLCPPHLAEQWQQELADKFHIEAELVLSSTIRRLESGLALGKSVFSKYPYTVVSTDFIKQDSRAEDFITNCPGLVIVDEAHGCTQAASKVKHQRHKLVSRISKQLDKHLVLVTATPHNGNEDAFRSLIALLNDSFADLSLDLDNSNTESARKKLAQHFVQRRRGDVKEYLENDTQFPEREDKEASYQLTEDYRQILKDILDFAREYVTDESTNQRQRRVRYWSALALLRCVSSSPAAAIATLQNRTAADSDTDSAAPEPTQEPDEIDIRTVLDQDEDDNTMAVDFSPGSDSGTPDATTKNKLRSFIKRFDAIDPNDDHKLQGAIKEIKSLLKAGFRPIVFCRFMDTSDYVAQHLQQALGDEVQVESVTGSLPPSEREARIDLLSGTGEKYVLVCTDCLSEGINLQENFDAVLHYDLAWNPTRHEQREGRVDRFGQPKPKVRVITYFGQDNPIDGVILDVLIRKHKTIKNTLGVTVSVPETSEQILETLFEGALFREQAGAASSQLELSFLEDVKPKMAEIHENWDKASQKASRSRYAQNTLNPDLVAEELQHVQTAIGRSEDVARFVRTALNRIEISFNDRDAAIDVHIPENVSRGMRQAVSIEEDFTGRFELPVAHDELYLGRTSEFVEGLASWLLDQSLDPDMQKTKATAARCGAFSSKDVPKRTTLLVARFRYHIQISANANEALLCEEIVPLAFTGSPQDDTLAWLPTDQSQALLDSTPADNLTETAMKQHVERLLADDIPHLDEPLATIAHKRAQFQLEAHKRCRQALKEKTKGLDAEPVLPVDIIGAYVLLPVPTAGGSHGS